MPCGRKKVRVYGRHANRNADWSYGGKGGTCRLFHALRRKSCTKRKSCTLKRKFLFRTTCNVSTTTYKNKKKPVPTSGSYLPYISPRGVESYTLPKTKLGEVIRLRSPFTPRKDISDHSVIASCRQSWVLSGPELMWGRVERDNSQKIFEKI